MQLNKFDTILDIQQAFYQQQISALQLTKYYLERIANFDKQGPTINAITELNPDALHIAEALDIEREQKGIRGPLHGIPILLKDNIDTGDHMHTSAGSIALANNYAKEDAFVVEKLREAGAIIIGKANLTEWANFMTMGMPNGYSSRGGQVLNPYGPGIFDVGGSSSGPGAAVAASFATASIGTETSGSILSPASSNTLVGIKPTVGLISRSGIIPISHSQDTAGPLAKTVTDAAIVLGALTGQDDKDPATCLSSKQSQTNYRYSLNKDGLKGATLGVDRNYFAGLSEEEAELIDMALEDLAYQGATILDPVEIQADPNDINVMIHEFKTGLNAYLANVSNQVPVQSLAEVIEYNEQHAERALKYGQTLLTASEKTSGTLTEPSYIQARLNDIRQAQSEGIDAVMDKHELDALVFVNNHGAGIAAKAGYPSITIPAGYTSSGKPVGLTFAGKAFTEEKLIELAYAYEQATKHRRNPVLD
ncbi:amidase [Aquibacillus sediminis]|uniref:amidase n=1 Tax=Aquibacillus sediminis TaxID=2574734 RepID=UPI0011083AE7|nr:amidase [Aquibacillus sediminis]